MGGGDSPPPPRHLKTTNDTANILISSETTWSDEEIEVSYDQIEQDLGGFWGDRKLILALEAMPTIIWAVKAVLLDFYHIFLIDTIPIDHIYQDICKIDV